MKISIIIVSPIIPPQPSGVGKRALRHAVWFSDNGYEVTLITGTDSIILDNNKITIKRIKKTIDNTKRKKTRHIYSIHGFIKNIFIIKKIINERKAKNLILHCFGAGPVTWITLFWAKWYGVKCVTELILLGNDDPTNKNLGLLKPYIIPWVLRKSSAVIGISPALIRSAEQVVHDHSRLYLIPNDVQENSYSEDLYSRKNKIKTDMGLSQYGKVILFVGGFTQRKGGDILVTSFIRYTKYNPDSVLVIVGRHEDHVHLKAKEKALSALNIRAFPENIRFVGYQHDVYKYYIIADALLFPSRREGFGNALIEAMAMKVPVIAKKIPGITDYIIDNGINGVIIDSEDPEEYASALMNILDDNIVRQNIIKNARNKVEKCFSQKVVMQKYIDMYENVIGQY